MTEHRPTTLIGGRVHHVDYGEPPDGPSVVLVHGLGGSHLNWDLLAPTSPRTPGFSPSTCPGSG